MEVKLNNHIQFKHISKATEEIVNYIQDRKDNKIKSLRTRWHKFNRLCMGGIEPNAIYTISGISGSGNSDSKIYLERKYKRYLEYCRLYEESYRVSQTNIGEDWNVNPEINK